MKEGKPPILIFLHLYSSIVLCENNSKKRKKEEEEQTSRVVEG